MGKKGNVREWQYSWEALCHVTTLRLYLFHPSVSPQDRCSEIRASLCPPHTLLIRWTEGHSLPVAVCVPVPAVVLDHSIPMQVKAMPDHIHVKFMLMFPVDHPLVGSFSSLLQTGDDPSQKEPGKKQSSFSLDNDTLMLASKGEIHFYCKNCSAKLTQEPLRKHTLQRVFINLLQASAECESSFRTVVRDLKTNVPMLQMVLLNANAWFCSGSCWERVLPGKEDAINTEELVEALAVEDGSKGFDGTNSIASGLSENYSCIYLKPVVKVLFCDCSSYAAEESRLIEDWALQKHAEDVYMLGEEIRALIDTLVSGKLRLPASCNSLQGFYLSFLEK